jgi:hypothetical protein
MGNDMKHSLTLKVFVLAAATQQYQGAAKSGLITGHI